jgi:ATP-dependent DNA helicase RecG
MGGIFACEKRNKVETEPLWSYSVAVASRRDITPVPSEMSIAQLWALLGASEESGTVEFKEQLPRPAKLQEPVVAFANHRGGVIVVGISKRRPPAVVGTRWGQDEAERVEEMSRETQPPVRVAVSASLVDGATVGFVQVAALEKGWVQTSDGRVLVRAGPTNRALVGLELLNFLRDRASEPVEDEIVRDATLDDLERRLVQKYLRARLGARRVAVDEALRDLGWLKHDGGLRLAAVLMFGKRPQRDNRRYGIEVLRFSGSVNGGAILRDRNQLTGPLPDLVTQADRLIYAEMRRDAVVRGLVREEVPEFPPVVVREALVNAVGHRNYAQRGSAIQVRLYDDALEIESPGTLPAYVTIENLREAQYSRNERVMDALQRLGLVEEAGQGIDRMFDAMEDALLDPPVFEERPSSFVVRLRGTSVFTAEDRLWAAQFGRLNLEADAKIALVYARRHGAIKNEDLRSLRNLDRDASRSVLQDLVARGLLEPLGRGRGARYVLGQVARHARAAPTLDDQLRAVLSHARRNGRVVNADVRGLLDVDRFEAREILYELVAQGLLRPRGERRGREYLPVERNDDRGAGRGAAPAGKFGDE